MELSQEMIEAVTANDTHNHTRIELNKSALVLCFPSTSKSVFMDWAGCILTK